VKKEKKKYQKPELVKNKPLVNITFSSVISTPPIGPGSMTGGGVATMAGT